MGTIWVKEFTGGLDARRLPEATSGGVLIKAIDGHVNRGGEFEQRAAFVPVYALPSGQTIGMGAGKNGIYVFGSGVTPTLPYGVSYQRLQHPDGVTELVNVPSLDLYAGKLYVVGEFADGSRYHFYDGARVADFYDGRARASFEVVSGGTSSPYAALTNIAVNGVNIMGSDVTWATSNSATAAAIAASINSNTSTPDYSATAVGSVVNIIASEAGAKYNGYAVVFNAGTGFVVNPTSSLVLSDGANPVEAVAAKGSFDITGGAASDTITSVVINSVTITNGTVTHTGNNTTTAAAVAASINNYYSTPDYKASASGTKVTITASDAGSAVNGQAITVNKTGSVAIANNTGMSGGVDASTTYVPGDFVKTIGSRMHCVSGSNEHFSGIKQPTKWTTDATGAGFIDMSTQDSGSQNLTALGKYQTNVAVFSDRVILIWYFDSDPASNKLVQVLANTGTSCGRSVTQFGDNDLFYLHESGVRSLKARDASNAAATTDIGIPVDPLIAAKLSSLSDADRAKVFGFIEPRDGRFWLTMRDEIFVFSFFESAKISAWSTYVPSIRINGVSTTFIVDEACVFNRRVYIRSGDQIYVYGGLGAERQYDETQAIAWLPYLDADKPASPKLITGIDVAAKGDWKVELGMNPVDFEASDTVGVITDTTYGNLNIATVGRTTHVSPRFTSCGSEKSPAILSAVVVHFQTDDDDEDN